MDDKTSAREPFSKKCDSSTKVMTAVHQRIRKSAKVGDISCENDESTEQKKGSERSKTIKGYLKKAVKFAFSHFGLCALVTLYAVAGGFIFQHLEKTNERQECFELMRRYAPMENATVHLLWDIASSFQERDDVASALDAFRKQIQNFRDDALTLNYDGSDCSAMGEPEGPQYRWSYPGALLFSVTVFTTIGYGNIAPKTFWGRVVCITYAVLGIPLMLLCLANLGEVMADVFRFVYARVCCCGFLRSRPRNAADERTFVEDSGLTDSNCPEAWAIRYNAKLKNTAAAVESVLSSPPYDIRVVGKDDDDDEDSNDDDDDDDDDDLKLTVPITVTMAVIAGYLFMGSLLFGVWEDWDWLKAAYYCFVTIATIGFGDVVPGSASFDRAGDQLKMIGATIYIVLGMAIMSMAFNLIQDEIVAKFTWIAEKLGILEEVANRKRSANEFGELKAVPVKPKAEEDSAIRVHSSERHPKRDIRRLQDIDGQSKEPEMRHVLQRDDGSYIGSSYNKQRPPKCTLGGRQIGVNGSGLSSMTPVNMMT